MPRTKLSRDLNSELRKLSTPTIKPKAPFCFVLANRLKARFWFAADR